MDIKLSEGEDGVPFIKLGEGMLRLDLEELDEAYQERSRIELRETPENIAHGLEKLKELIKAEEGWNVPTEIDSYLLKFLRPCKFYPESAFKLMKKYYKFKLKNPNLALGVMPATVKHVFENEIISFFPVRTEKGCRVMHVRVGNWDTKKATLQDLFRTVTMCVEIAMIEPTTQVAGAYVLLDMKGLTLQHVWQFTPMFAKTALEFIQETIPIRLKGIHIINQPYIFKMLYAIFKPFINEKLRKRLYFHGVDRKSLFSHIAKEYIPSMYEGTLSIPLCPGYLLAEILTKFDSEFELCNAIGYTEVKLQINNGILVNKLHVCT